MGRPPGREFKAAASEALDRSAVTANPKLALRRLAKSPGFTLIALVMLGLGIGMSTTAFSVANSDLLRPVSFPDGDRLVRIFRTTQQSQNERHSPANFLFLKSAATSYSSVSAYYWYRANIAERGKLPEVKLGASVSANFLTTLGIRPIIGRGLAPDEDQPGKGAVILLTESFWKENFGGDPKIVGKTLRVGTDLLTVIGVLADFDSTTSLYRMEFVRPEIFWPNFPTVRAARWFNILARLKPGASLSSARAELSTLAARIDRDFPADESTDNLRVTPLAGSDVDKSTSVLYWLIVGLASLVLLIACANLASLQLARALARSYEFGVRSALGASRYDLMMPLLFESLELTFAGSALGVLLGYWANHLVSRYLWAGWPIHFDGRVLLFVVVVSLATALIFGLAPAWMASKTSPGDALKKVSRSSTSGGGQHRFKNILVVGQLASALILVSAALSFGIAVRQSLKKSLGWEPAGLFVGFFSINDVRYDTEAKRSAFLDELRAKLARIPGVADVSISGAGPIYGYFHQERIAVDGRPPEPVGREQPAEVEAVDSEYFRMLGIRLLAGRTFASSLKATDPRAVVINEAMARRYWPDGDPIGKKVRLANETAWGEVIGVVNDVRMDFGFSVPYSRIQIYRALVQVPEGHHSFILRSTLSPDSLRESARTCFGTIDPDTMMESTGTAEGVRWHLVSGYSVWIVSFGAFALVGLLIALIGQYAVITQLAMQRHREIGIRIALGASYAAILRLVLSQGASLILFGTTLGLLGAFAVSRVFQRTLPELRLPGLGLEATITILFCLAGLIACYLPARRAGRVDPVVALRAE
jgi:putative ABC transport system permease protein